MKTKAILLGLCVCIFTPTRNNSQSNPIYLGQGSMSGAVTETSVILQSRLTARKDLFNHDLPGIQGFGRFEISTLPEFDTSFYTEWIKATAENDYIIKVLVGELEPATRYYYRLWYGSSKDQLWTGDRCTFRTWGGAAVEEPIHFVVVTGMNVDRFYRGDNMQGFYIGPDRNQGFPALETILKLRPDFFIGTGDNVYYDAQSLPFGDAQDEEGIRRCYHEQFVRDRFKQLFSTVSTYWEKDDHDYRYNDCDNSGDQLPLPDLGKRMFREQLPVTDPSDPNSITYGTYQITRDLQVWLVEGREYRSDNTMENGPEKTIWGPEQKKWLKRTLLESDATFKILVSATPMVGPDGSHKIDNHTNHNGFRNEGDEFFRWLKENDFDKKNFYIACGDRHWQYHSIHPSGFEEFSCGALVDANSRLGLRPGDPESTDPNAEIIQPFTNEIATGGFLSVKIIPEQEGAATAVFTFYDERGVVLYETVKNVRR